MKGITKMLLKSPAFKRALALFEKSDTFLGRIVVAGIAVACLCMVVLIMLLAMAAKSEEPRNATPAEISEAALAGQMEAMRRAGYSEDCLFEVKIFGNLCIQQCIGTGFALRLKDDYPECRIDYCVCEEPTS
jgi:hypothetical protein